MRMRLLLAVMAAMALAGPGQARAADCPTLGLTYETGHAILRFELDPALCAVPADVLIQVGATLEREGPLEGQGIAVHTSCSAGDVCVVELVMEHPSVEHAVYQGRVDYEAIWDDGFVAGGAIVITRCTSVVTVAVCNP